MHNPSDISAKTRRQLNALAARSEADPTKPQPDQPGHPKDAQWIEREIPTGAIIIESQALRYDLDDDGVIELALDIATHGLMQPIGVAPRGENSFQLLWGGRRLAAHRRLNLATIHARIYDAGEQPVKAIALRENLLRAQLSLREECDAVAYLHVTDQLSPDQIGSLLSKSRAWVLRRLAIPNLPEELREPVFDGSLPISHAEEISRVQDEGSRRYLLNQTLASKPSLSNLRAACEVYASGTQIEEAVAAGMNTIQPSATAPTVYLDGQVCTEPTRSTTLTLLRVCPRCHTLITTGLEPPPNKESNSQ